MCFCQFFRMEDSASHRSCRVCRWRQSAQDDATRHDRTKRQETGSSLLTGAAGASTRRPSLTSCRGTCHSEQVLRSSSRGDAEAAADKTVHDVQINSSGCLFVCLPLPQLHVSAMIAECSCPFEAMDTTQLPVTLQTKAKPLAVATLLWEKDGMCRPLVAFSEGTH